MNNWWIRFGCFLTGYNYAIVKNSSEVAAKAVKKYTAALIIVCILWAFIGYSFTHRYLQGGSFASLAGAILAVVIIVQIERQIILSVSGNYGLYIFRGCLALMMALIGAVIIDQIILKQDIELEKLSYIDKRVDNLLPLRTADLKTLTQSLDSVIRAKDNERQNLINDVSSQPFIKNITTQTQMVPVPITQTDSLGKSKTVIVMKPSNTQIIGNSVNPKQFLVGPLDTVISQLRTQKNIKDDALLNIRPVLLEEIKSKVGFLDELKVMFGLISGSSVALCFWLLWLLFLLFIELLVLFSKIGDKKNDYDRTIMHHMELQLKKLDLFAKMAEER